MDISYVLFITILLFAGFSLWRYRVLPFHQRRGWTIKFWAFLTIAPILYFLAPLAAGYILTATWLTLIVAPSIFLNRAAKHSLAMRYDRARRALKVASLLHPYDGSDEKTELMEALYLWGTGETSRAADLLSMRALAKDDYGMIARLYLLRIEQRWPEVLATIQTMNHGTAFRGSPIIHMIYLRALGECGQINSLLAEIRISSDILQKTDIAGQAKLFAFAFSGRETSTNEIIKQNFHSFPEEIRRFWQATAQMAAGELVSSSREFKALGEAKDHSVRAGAELRLKVGLANARQELSPLSESYVCELESQLRNESNFRESSNLALRPNATYGLIATNTLVFLAESLLGGNENPETLINLGAFVPVYTYSTGEGIWRVLTAQFLHFGILHVAMNMLGLLALGPFVERSLGRVRYVYAYILSGAFGFGILLAGCAMNLTPAGFYVGASASVMGLVGATGAILLNGWKRHRAISARNRLRDVVAIVLLQIVFDFSVPQVSNTAHMGGLVSGFIITFFILKIGESRDIAAKN